MKAREWACSVVLFTSAALSACGPTVVVNGPVAVTIASGPDQGQDAPKIDVSDPRLAVAQREITELLGRPLTFEVGEALAPYFRYSLHEAFVGALETTVSSLHALKRRNPASFAYGRQYLRSLRWNYSANTQVPRPKLDITSGRLSFLIPPAAHRLLAAWEIADAFDVAWQSVQRLRYMGVSARTVPVGEHVAYLDFLKAYRPARPASKEQRRQADVDRLSQIIALYPHLKDAELRSDAQDVLVRAAPGLRRDLEQGAPFAQSSHAKWLGWLNGAHERLSKPQAEKIARLMFDRRGGATPEFRDGFDALAFSHPYLKSWLVAGSQGSRAVVNGLSERIVCPYARDRQRGTLSAPGYCAGTLFTDLATSEAGRRRLVKLLQEHHAAALTQSAVLHILSELGVETLLPLLEVLVYQPSTSHDTLLALADFGQWGPQRNKRGGAGSLDFEPLRKVIALWWHRYPERHAELLYVLTEAGRNYEGSIVWPKLSTWLGTQLTRKELADYLRLGRKTLWSIRQLRWSFSPGWSRSALLVPALESWLNQHNAKGERGPEPYYATERVVEVLCQTGTQGDVRALQAFVKTRLDSYPSERVHLGSFAAKPLKKLCPASAQLF